MKGPDRIVRAPGGVAALLRSVPDPDEVGVAVEPGVIVEVDRRTAEDCGAWIEDCVAADEAFEAAEDPADFPQPDRGRP